MVYTKKYKARIADFTSESALSLRSILEILEDIATSHSKSVENDVIESAREGVAWILTEWNVKILGKAELGEQLTVNTWAVGNKPTTSAPREFEIINSRGERIVAALARLALMNTERGRLIRMSREFFDAYNPEENAKFNFEGSVINEPIEYEKSCEINVRRADIDFNNHVHNTVYMDYASEIMQSEIAEISFFKICYKTSAQYGELLTLKSTKGDKEQIGVYHKDGTLCALIEAE